MSDNLMRSNVHCTNCYRDFSAELDLDLEGNHVIVCPLCQHEHYRVVRRGVVTEERWRSSSGPVYYAATSTATISVSYSSWDTTSTGGTSISSTFTRDVWLNGTAIT
jgi:hypothetical protein